MMQAACSGAERAGGWGSGGWRRAGGRRECRVRL